VALPDQSIDGGGGLAQVDKYGLSEREICTKIITPAIQAAGWEQAQFREEVSITDGRIMLRGKLAARVRNPEAKGGPKRADYVLYSRPNVPLAVIEAKQARFPVGHGMQQALTYAEMLDAPFAISSNGNAFLLHDRTGLITPTEREVSVDGFPTHGELWALFQRWNGLTEPTAVALVAQPFYTDGSGKQPRYYQRVAINRAIEAIAKGQQRILLVMATGTGKTYTAFQIIWRLWKAKAKKRILFLADRNILVDQTIQQDFAPFGEVMHKVTNREAKRNYEIYLALYQAVTGREEWKQIYRQFPADFFDLIVIDECHRGSAREQSAWRDILDWFEPAVQLGLTATPKETSDVSTNTYFGEPVYTYSLKQGIEDGFLAPYKVVRIDLDRDLQGWRPPSGMVDDLGQLIEDRVYNQRDMDRVLVLNQRTRLVASKLIDYLLGTDPYGKTIVFCEDIDHAERMRSALVNEIAVRMPHEKGNLKMVVRITGDNDEGKRALDDFIHPERRYPVIATTSKLLTTGVDAQTCKVIVLDQRIESMIEFKQIVGRGTRIHEDTGKLWFTIMDFKKATELFADPDFDGEPVVIYEPGKGGPVTPPDDEDDDGGDTGQPEPEGRVKYVISGVTVMVVAERIQYYGKDGKLITESLRDYTRTAVKEHYASVDDFLRRWSSADKKQAVIDELREEGVLFEELRDQVGRDIDPFDLVCHVVYDRPPLTRRERADQVKKRDVFTRFGEKARAVLQALLEKYADQGVVPDDLAVLRVQPLSAMGTPVEIVKQFGGRDAYLAAVRALEAELYRDAG
jgi:type I restriction enzyme R subunit